MTGPAHECERIAPSIRAGLLCRSAADFIDVSLFRDFDVLPVAPEPQWDPVQRFYDSPLNAARPVTEGRFLTIVGVDTSGVTTTTTSGSWSGWVTVMLAAATRRILRAMLQQD